MRDDQPITLDLAASFKTATHPTQRVCEVAAMFGLGVDETHEVTVVPPTRLTLTPGQIVFITGASGGGKTTLLRLIRQQLEASGRRVIDFTDPPNAFLRRDSAPDAALVDRIGNTLEEAVRYLSLAGLNDAAVMLRRPHELSDGQRYRLRLAEAMALAADASPPKTPEQQSEKVGGVGVLADEFGATLDRLTAAVIARNVRKWTRRTGICFVAATTHDDLLEPLEPDILIVQQPGSEMQIITR
ncbi:MAG: ATP-binding cassette domain-containing protein [Phycisphaeraceae bacterium]